MIRIKLSAILGERRVTQADLARRTNIRPNTICDIYNELCDRVSLEHLDLICEALNCDISDLLERVDNSDPLLKYRSRQKNKKKDR